MSREPQHVLLRCMGAMCRYIGQIIFAKTGVGEQRSEH